MAKHIQDKQSAQEKSLRAYFRSQSTSRIRWIAIALAALVAVGMFVIAASLAAGGDPDSALVFATGGTVAGLIGALLLILRRKQSRLSDLVIDKWLDQGLDKIKAQSMAKFGIVTQDLVGAETLIISAPILWNTFGIDDDDLVFKVGDDSIIRFGVYRVTVIHLTQYHLDTYGCDYNFLKDAVLNEETGEYPYRHVVSVATRDFQSNYTLQSGETFTHAQVFGLHFSSGEKIEVVIEADKLTKIKGRNSLPETGADKAVAAIRKMMREISATENRHSAASAPPPLPMPLPVPPVSSSPAGGSIAPTTKMGGGQGLWLVDQRTGQRYALGQTTTIGRAPDNTVVLADPMVSGYHAVVQLEPAGYIVYDQNSANGTFADGHRLTGPHKLIPGRRLRLGNSEFLISAM